MAFHIPEGQLTKLKQQAKDADMAYATILDQHIYDLNGLADVLKTRLQKAETAKDTKEAQDLTHKLQHAQDEIAAYEKEKEAHPA